MNAYRGPPMTLGNAAAAKVRLIVWCRRCGTRSSPIPTKWRSFTAPRSLFLTGKLASSAPGAGAGVSISWLAAPSVARPRAPRPWMIEVDRRKRPSQPLAFLPDRPVDGRLRQWRQPIEYAEPGRDHVIDKPVTRAVEAFDHGAIVAREADRRPRLLRPLLSAEHIGTESVNRDWRRSLGEGEAAPSRKPLDHRTRHPVEVHHPCALARQDRWPPPGSRTVR